MKTTHTPGPWRWEHNVDSSRAVIYAPDSAEQGIIGTVNLCRGGSETDGEANARLIAKAPELADYVRTYGPTRHADDCPASAIYYKDRGPCNCGRDAARALLAAIDGGPQ